MKRPPRQLRLEQDVEEEVKKIAEVTDLPDIEVIRQIVKAGTQAIKENGYKLPLPLALKVTASPERKPGNYPDRSQESNLLNEPVAPHPSSSSETRDTVRKYAKALREKYSPEKDAAPPRK